MKEDNQKIKKKGNKLELPELQNVILNFLKEHPKKQYSAKQIIEKLDIGNNKDSVNSAIGRLIEGGELFMNVKNAIYGVTKAPTYDKAKEKTKTEGKPTDKDAAKGRSERRPIIGIVDMTRSGTAYIVSNDVNEDVFVNVKNTNSALHGDKVRVEMWTPRGRNKPEGEVKEVLHRATDYFMGTIKVSRKYAFVIPDRANMLLDIFVELVDSKDAKDGDKVVVKVTKWPTRTNRSPLGVVTTVLGAAGGNDIEMNGILIGHGFNIDFPEEVTAESDAISTEITAAEIARRRDLRGILTFTIDPFDAKDFDDAISYRALDNGNFEIGVHIADVSHYVHANTQLDKEAYKRSTSVYLADRVCPMLPEKLSNELCSLRPHEDKLTFSAMFEIGSDGIVVNRWFGKTVIYSDRRLTYEEAQEILEGKPDDYSAALLQVNELAIALRKNRFKNGAIDFDSEEVRFRFDEKGVPVEVYVKTRKASNMLVEDFMLLANKEVATFITKKGKAKEIPFVYRIHDTPNEDKLADFARFAMDFGFKMDLSTPKRIAESMTKLVKAAETDDNLKMLAPLAIRTMSKAEYSSNNIGHYGLAFEFYSHFTSPIRRYSDVLAHRILEKNLEEKPYYVVKEDLEESCKHISKQERRAMEAERESTKYKQSEYMSKRIGQVFEGVISGMLDRGLFVEVKESKCEGLITFATMNEAFEIEGNRMSAKGKRTGKTYKMGDTVYIKVIATDMAKRQIEMIFVDKDEENEA